MILRRVYIRRFSNSAKHCIPFGKTKVRDLEKGIFSYCAFVFSSNFLKKCISSLYRLAVRVLSSERAGAGKSLVVCRLSQSLPGLKNNETVVDFLRDMEADVPLCITVPIYGPFVHQYTIAESLLPHTIVPDLPLSRVFHLDVHPSVGEYFITPDLFPTCNVLTT